MKRGILAYDIAEDSTRHRASVIASGYMFRVQKSVFEGVISESDIRELLRRLGELPLGPEDSIRYYTACVRCSEQIVLYGAAGPIEKLPYIFV